MAGKSDSRRRVMEARWEPASMARTEFLDHFVAQERTKKPVTLSSLGPPPDACYEEELLAELTKLAELKRRKRSHYQAN